MDICIIVKKRFVPLGRLLLSLLIAFLSQTAISAAAERADGTGPRFSLKISSAAKVYSAPRMESELLGSYETLGGGIVVGKKADWYLLKLGGGRIGYIHKSSVAALPLPDPIRSEKKATEPRWSIEPEFDAYYTNVGLYVNLTDEPIMDAGSMEEGEVYKKLFLSSLVPKQMVLEAAVFPMPVLGVIIKNRANDFYQDAQVSGDLNLVKALTAGFDEPYAINIFFGNVIKFTKPGEEEQQGNFGYMGFLISAGDKHIKDNELIDDDWAEIEWKVKGDRKFSDRKLSWSYRIGAKVHSHPDIRDAYYVGLRRSRLEYESSPSAFMNNMGIEYRYDVDSETLRSLRHYLLVDKKFPLKEKKFAFTLGLGLIWDSNRRYTGLLADRAGEKDVQFIIRPNVQF